MTTEEMIDYLVDDDIGYILRVGNEGEADFLNSVLRGEGWKPYSMLTEEEITNEYNERIHENEQ